MTAPLSLILLHGFAGLPTAWDEVIAAIRRASVAPLEINPLPLAGHGLAGPQPGAGSFEAEVDRLASAIREIGCPNQRCHIAGYSMGGRLALGLLCRHPRLFSGATLIGAHWGIEDAEDLAARHRWDEEWAAKLETEGLESFLEAWENLDLFSTQDAQQRATLRRLRRNLDPRALAAALRAFGTGVMPCYRRALASLELPTTWVAGARDPKFSALGARAAGTSFLGRAITLPQVGHNIPVEAPEALAEILLQDCHQARDPAQSTSYPSTDP